MSIFLSEEKDPLCTFPSTETEILRFAQNDKEGPERVWVQADFARSSSPNRYSLSLR
jgi:hypothetical protein